MRILLWLLFLPLLVFAQPAAVPLTLTSKTSLAPLNVTLSDADWRWLGLKRGVKIAIWQPETPPFNVEPEEGIAEGINADYLKVISTNLGLSTQIVRYASRDEALAALQAGEVDAVQADAGDDIPLPDDLVNSLNYQPNQPVMVVGKSSLNNELSPAKVKNVVVASHYMSDSWLRSQFPAAHIARFPSNQSAITEVGIHEDRAFIGNLVTANFLIERNYNNSLAVANLLPADGLGSHLILRQQDSILLRTLNAVITKIPFSQHRVITNQWTVGTSSLSFGQSIAMTEKEQRWIANNRNIKVVLDPFFAPFSFFDSDQRFMGISADVLREIHLRTGLNFQATFTTRTPEISDNSDEMGGDVIAALSQSPAREHELLFSRPYLQTPWVLIVANKSDSAMTLQNGMRLAINYGNELIPEILEHFPAIKIVYADNTSQAMQMVIDGQADAAVNNQISADYMLGRFFAGKLKLGQRLSEKPAFISFAVPRDRPELLSILNKAVADIPPRTVSQIINSWQQGADVKLNTWTLYNRPFYWLIAASALTLALALLWVVTMRREVRSRRTAQAKLIEELAFRETLLNGSPSPVYVLNREGETLNHNLAYRHFFSHLPAELLQLSLYDQRHPLAAFGPTLLPLINEQIQQPQRNYTQRWMLSDGKEDHIIDHWATAWTDAEGRAAGLICGWQDITEIENERDRAEKASKAKSSFLATMSHEIRTPISAIIGLLELSVMDAKNPNPELKLAWDSAQSLLGLIGDILDMAKIESGQLELEPVWTDLRQLVSPTVPVFNGLARLKNLTLDVDHVGETNYEVLIDPLRFKQILYNFISNALKFTAEGGVVVRMHTTLEDESQIQLHLSINDTGCGISQRDQQSLFQPYTQLSEGKKQTGTGLGLTIAADLIQKMAGDIDLFSAPGKGTQVDINLTLPARALRPGLTEQHHSLPVISSGPLSVLIVDDNAINRMLLKNQLVRLNHQVIEAREGEEALSLWQQHPVDLIITDCNMPGIDGLELTQRIRQQDRQLLIFGLTANAQQEERQRCLDAGMNDCLFKPLRFNTLQALLTQISTSSTTQDLEAVLNLSGLKEMTDGDMSLVKRILLKSAEDDGLDVVHLKEAVQQNRWPDASKLLHRLAGSAQVTGLYAVGDIALELEQRCLADPGRDPSLADAVNTLCSKLEGTHQILLKHFA